MTLFFLTSPCSLANLFNQFLLDTARYLKLTLTILGILRDEGQCSAETVRVDSMYTLCSNCKLCQFDNLSKLLVLLLVEWPDF